MRFFLMLVAMLLVARVAPAASEQFPSSAGTLTVETVAGGLVHPWALAFLPDGNMLVTERPGRMRIVTRGGRLSPPLAGVPKVYAREPSRLAGRHPRQRFRATAATSSSVTSNPTGAAAASRSPMPACSRASGWWTARRRA